MPLITVAMPIYNAGEYLRMAVVSIIEQSVLDWELLIIDDGSTDNALALIADINDNRIKIIRDGLNKGLAARLNEAIDLARGKYIARMDQDDISYPERFSRQVEVLNRNMCLDMVAVRAVSIDEDGQLLCERPYILTHEEICRAPWRGFYLPHPTWMGRTEWFRKHRYSLPAHYFCEDQELLLRSYAQSHFGTVNEILFAYRIRTAINWKKHRRTRFAVLKMQLSYFLSKQQPVFFTMSLLVFFARLAADALAYAKRGASHHAKINQKTAQAWEKVKNLMDAWQIGHQAK